MPEMLVCRGIRRRLLPVFKMTVMPQGSGFVCFTFYTACRPTASLRSSSVQELDVHDVVHSSVHAVSARRSRRDLRVGDTLLLNLRAKKVPFGGFWYEPHRRARETLLDAAWRELEDIDLRARSSGGRPIVRGRVLNELVGMQRAFAVGVAGFVAKLPMARADPLLVQRLGELQDFQIIQMSAAQRRLWVAHPGTEGAHARGMPEHQAHLRRRTVADP